MPKTREQFMQLEITRKGSMAVAQCDKCGTDIVAHEFATWDFNGERDALQRGTMRCTECCTGRADAGTFTIKGGGWYAGRYSAPGYLDCTAWEYDTNRRRLERTLRDLHRAD